MRPQPPVKPTTSWSDQRFRAAAAAAAAWNAPEFTGCVIWSSLVDLFVQVCQNLLLRRSEWASRRMAWPDQCRQRILMSRLSVRRRPSPRRGRLNDQHQRSLKLKKEAGVPYYFTPPRCNNFYGNGIRPWLAFWYALRNFLIMWKKQDKHLKTV